MTKDKRRTDMTQMQFQTHIQSPVETVFQLIADFGNYDQWLTPSNTYRHVSSVSAGPVTLGSTYSDRGPMTLMEGKVIAFDPPQHITFEQKTKSGILGTLKVRTDYRLTPSETGTDLLREVTVTILGLFRLLQAQILASIKQENLRILERMKGYLEKVE
jgi:uncharacterized protein YndB with AHSA1/START domain